MNNRVIYISNSNRPPSREELKKRTVKLNSIDSQFIKDGDTILLKGGEEFEPMVIKGLKNLKIGSFGYFPAKINGADGNGLILEECENVQVFGLIIKGTGWKQNRNGIGLHIKNCRGTAVTNTEVYGFRNTGIEIYSSDDTVIEGCFTHNNGFCGINNFIGENMSHNLLIRYCRSYDNAGNPDIKDNHSGSGIAIFHVKNAVVEYCEAAGNGWGQRQRNINGPVGVWCACDCTDVIFRKSISRHNCTQPGGVDGDGFDIDGGVINGLMEYNYSFENEGSGYLFCEYGSGLEWKNNNMHHCISINDGQRVPQQGSVQYYGPDWLCLDKSKSEKCLLVPAPGRHCIVNKEIGRECKDISVQDSILVQGTVSAVSTPGNLYSAVSNNTVIANKKLYSQIIENTPRITDPRKLDKIEIFDALDRGEGMEAGLWKLLFGICPKPEVNYGKKEFTYYLSERDFEGSDYSGEVKLVYDHIKPGYALSMRGAGSRIQFEYPAWQNNSKHIAVLSARIESADVMGYLYVAEEDKIVAATAIGGNIGDYSNINLVFNGFKGTPYLGVIITDGDAAVFLDKIEVYKNTALINTDMNSWRYFGDTYAEDHYTVLNKKGSGLCTGGFSDGQDVTFAVETEAWGNGAVMFVRFQNQFVIKPIECGRHEHTITVPGITGFYQAGLCNNILEEQESIKVLSAKLI